MWIDRILELDRGRRIVTIKHVSLAEEHLHDHFPAIAGAPGRPARPAFPVMPASLIVEGVAQSGGILVGHSIDFRENIVLAKIARVELEREAVPGDTLRYDLSIERSDRQGVSTTAAVTLTRPGAAPSVIGRVDLIFSLLENASSLSGAPQVPTGNFVFSESFGTLLRLSGIGVMPAEPPAVTSR